MTTSKKDEEVKDVDANQEEWEEVANNWVSWGKEGNYIIGTLIAVREIISKLPGKAGEKIAVYELKADAGVFNQMDDDKKPIEPAINIEAEQIWNIGGKPIIDRQMRNIKLGTKVYVKYTKTEPPRNKGFNPLKVIKVLTKRGRDGKPVMDEKWLAEVAAENDAEKQFNNM